MPLRRLEQHPGGWKLKRGKGKGSLGRRGDGFQKISDWVKLEQCSRCSSV